MDHLRFKLDGLMPSRDGFGDWLKSNSKDALEASQKALSKMHDGSAGFWALADNPTQTLAPIKEYEESLQGRFKDVLVIGIGGSSLGPKALQTALGSSSQKRSLHFIDNSDPETLGQALERCDLANTLVNVVTKSGGTSETIAAAMVVFDKLKQGSKGTDWKSQVVLTTDPTKGPLRKLASSQGFKTFEIPDNVGGRFSVLSAVGLVPGVLAGFDVKSLLDGAKEMKEHLIAPVRSGDLRSNPALALGVFLKNHFDANRNLVVVMPYVDRMLHVCEWFKQLWGESIGKAKSIDGDVLHTGSTPLVFRGATDQHSQLQLYAEGPDDKVYLSLVPDNRKSDFVIPDTSLKEATEYDYLRGKSLSSLIRAQHDGTMATLMSLARPTATIEANAFDEQTCGGLMMFFMATTAFAGPLFNVNPFDQPGVEKAKKLAFAGLKRQGYEEYGDVIDAYKKAGTSFGF